MARDTGALKIEKWAATGNVQDLEDGGVTRSTGWDATYSQAGGNLPKREHFNELLRELTALAVELNKHGILSWDTSVSYMHPAYVVVSDNRLYVSVRNNSGVDPTTDSGEDDWKPLIATPDGSVGIGTSEGDLATLGTGGKFPLARISTLPASQVTEGQFAEARIPTLSASKIPNP